jgi:hypothetical protein
MPHTAVSRVLLPVLLVLIAAIWIYHLAQRRFAAEGERKRFATLIQTFVLIGLWVCCYVMRRLAIDDLLLLPLFSAAAATILWKKGSFFPYRSTCAQCGKCLSLQRILFYDSNMCDTCYPEGGKRQ